MDISAPNFIDLNLGVISAIFFILRVISPIYVENTMIETFQYVGQFRQYDAKVRGKFVDITVEMKIL